MLLLLTLLLLLLRKRRCRRFNRIQKTWRSVIETETTALMLTELTLSEGCERNDIVVITSENRHHDVALLVVVVVEVGESGK